MSHVEYEFLFFFYQRPCSLIVHVIRWYLFQAFRTSIHLQMRARAHLKIHSPRPSLLKYIRFSCHYFHLSMFTITPTLRPSNSYPRPLFLSQREKTIFRCNENESSFTCIFFLSSSCIVHPVPLFTAASINHLLTRSTSRHFQFRQL